MRNLSVRLVYGKLSAGIAPNVPRVCVGRFINDKLLKMENQLDKIISFAKEKQQTDVNSHRGAYQTIIDYCQALRILDVVGRSEQLKAFSDYAQKRMWEDGDKDLSEFVDEFLSL